MTYTSQIDIVIKVDISGYTADVTIENITKMPDMDTLQKAMDAAAQQLWDMMPEHEQRAHEAEVLKANCRASLPKVEA